jgi:hypothetical protein
MVVAALDMSYDQEAVIPRDTHKDQTFFGPRMFNV